MEEHCISFPRIRNVGMPNSFSPGTCARWFFRIPGIRSIPTDRKQPGYNNVVNAGQSRAVSARKTRGNAPALMKHYDMTFPDNQSTCPVDNPVNTVIVM